MWFRVLTDDFLDRGLLGCATSVAVPQTMAVSDDIENFYADAVDTWPVDELRDVVAFRSHRGIYIPNHWYTLNIA